MTAGNASDARAMVRESRVELIVVCPNWPVEARFYGTDGRNPDAFYSDLAAGRRPSYLEAVPLPEHLGRHFRLYSVAEPS